MTILAKTLIAFGLLVVGSTSYTQESAEQLVASMKKADMTYRELMANMGRSIGTMQNGVLTANREMVEQGAYFILNHPAPKHAPWAIMPSSDQAGFKSALLTYDKVLDINTKAVVQASNQRDWIAAGEKLAELQGACVSCHVQWQSKALKWAPLKQ